MAEPDLDRNRLGNELLELLNELRVQLPGVQALFAFMLMVPFTDRFQSVSGVDRYAYFSAFAATTLAAAFLTAPSVYHRLHWRRDVQDKDEMLRIANRLALVGSVLLAIAMSTTVFVLSDVLLGRSAGIAVSALMASVFATLWYVLPLGRRHRERAKKD